MLVVLRSRGEERQAAQRTMLQLQNTPVDNLWPAHSPLCEIIMSYYVIDQTSALSLHCFDDGSSCSCTFETTLPSRNVWDVVSAMHLCLIMLDYYLIAWSMCRSQLIHKTVPSWPWNNMHGKLKGRYRLIWLVYKYSEIFKIFWTCSSKWSHLSFVVDSNLCEGCVWKKKKIYWRN